MLELYCLTTATMLCEERHYKNSLIYYLNIVYTVVVTATTWDKILVADVRTPQNSSHTSTISVVFGGGSYLVCLIVANVLSFSLAEVRLIHWFTRNEAESLGIYTNDYQCCDMANFSSTFDQIVDCSHQHSQTRRQTQWIFWSRKITALVALAVCLMA